MISSGPHYGIASTFHGLSQFVFKTEHFSLHFSRELHVEILSGRFVSPNLHRIEISKLLT